MSVHDAYLFDLDGVLYYGPHPVPGAPEGVATLRGQGARVAFITNNASRNPADIAAHLSSLGIEAATGDVVTSAQAVARLMARDLPPGATVLVAGSPALHAEVSAVGLFPVGHFDPTPDAVVQGFDPHLTWPRVTDVCHAIQAGSRWYASNLDATVPRPAGLEPGLGAIVDLVAGVVGQRPRVAGKPEPELLELTVDRLGCQRPLFVGDRLDTDIAGATRVSMASALVLTGVHGLADACAADPHARPGRVVAGIGDLSRPQPAATAVSETLQACGDQRASVDRGIVELITTPDRRQVGDASQAVMTLAWRSGAMPSPRTLEALDPRHPA